jgi:uncharacterized phage-associated protein
MPVREKSFSPEKALESTLYIASRLQNPTIHEILKLRYFADKLHLAAYGFVASGDEYVAMKFGPVASSTYNLLKAARGDQSVWIDPRLYEIIEGALVVERGSNRVVPQRDANIDHLSKADVAMLDEAIARYGNMSFRERTHLSHDTAWKAAWEVAEEDEAGQSPMPVDAIASTLENAEEIIEHLNG